IISFSSITIQTNYMVGALLNASFGSLTEIILFALAMRKGQLNNLILYALTGGLLNDTLLIPGLKINNNIMMFNYKIVIIYLYIYLINSVIISIINFFNYKIVIIYLYIYLINLIINLYLFA